MPFSYENEITIEKSPSYFRNTIVAKRVFDLNPKMKLILVLCSPIKRTISIYVHMLAHRSLKYNSRKHKNNSEHLASEIFYKNGSVIIDDSKSGLRKKAGNLIFDSLYVVHLKNWLKYFTLEQILLINGDEFIRNPYNEVKKIENFLNLKSFVRPEFYIFDENKGFYCLNTKLVTQLKEDSCLGEDKGREKPVIDKHVIDKLKDFYKPYNFELFKLINQTPFWQI